MRLLYGVVGEGMGHAIRSRVVLEHLFEQGHEVEIMASSRAADYLAKRFPEVHRIHGLHIIYDENRVRRGATLFTNVLDGSNLCADMAVHNVIGDAFRGASWVSLHNGGGVGWGEAINGGFGLLLDGSDAAARRLENMLAWDVTHGLARRAWARNPGAIQAVRSVMEGDPRVVVTLPHLADGALVERSLREAGD